MSLPALAIRRAIDAYRVRCWLTGPRCRCGCLCRIPWDLIRSIGGYEAFKSHGFPSCLVYHDLEYQFPHTIPMDLPAFRNLLIQKQYYFRRHVNTIRTVVEAWGDEYTAMLLGMERIASGYRKVKGWTLYMSYTLNESFPKTAAVLSKWFQGIAPQYAWVYVYSNYKTLYNPALRTLLANPQNKKVSMATAAVYADLNTPTIRVVRTGKFSQEITRYYWQQTIFWCHHVRAKVRAWRTSFSLRTRLAFAPTEPIERLLVRNPSKVPHAAYNFSTAIHRQPDEFLKLTMSYKKSTQLFQERALQQWIVFLATSKTPNAARALRKIWRTCSRSNAKWYFAFLNILLDAPVSHNRLLVSVLHQSLKQPTQFSKEMAEFFWKTMRKGQSRPSVIAKLLYISNLRGAWQANGHHVFYELLWSPAVKANIRHPCVSKEIAQYLSTTMVLRLGDMTRRDTIQQILWESPAIQKTYQHLQSTYKERCARFWECAAARWKVKRLRQLQHNSKLLAMPAFRTLAIRSTYTWRKLQAMTCPICMEEKPGHMVPLHHEIRHGICKECRDTIVGTTNRCPLCRVSLSYKTSSEEVFYEDEWYDDDQMYHYD